MPAQLSTPSFAARAVRLVAMSVLLVAGVFFALLLVVRLVVFPAIESRRVDIAEWMAKRIGQPVEIDALVTGWDGWNPKLSVQGFRVRARDAERSVLLELPRVDLLVAWTSLPLLDLRLKELLIEGPRLAFSGGLPRLRTQARRNGCASAAGRRRTSRSILRGGEHERA